MKLLAMSLVRNEEDLIEAFLRYHSSFVDRIVVIDHCSTDTTADIVRRLIAEGLPIELRREEGVAQHQSQALTNVLQEALESYAPEWILPLDADEMLTCAPGTSPRDQLDTLPQDRLAHLPWKTYLPTVHDDPEEPSLFRRQRHRRATEDGHHHKVLIPGGLLKGHKIRIEQGNHGVFVQKGLEEVPLPAQLAEPLWLSHFPIRSSQQLSQKILLGWPSHVARHRKTYKEAFHWKAHFERCRSGKPWSPEELQEVAMGYSMVAETLATTEVELVEDPFTGCEPMEEELDWIRREHDPSSLLKEVAGLAEHLAESHAEAQAALETQRTDIRAGKEILAFPGWLAEQLESLQSKLADELAASRNRTEKAEVEIERLTQQREQLIQQAEELERQLADTRRQEELLKSSRSWRWTRPLRFLEKLRHGDS